jgi:hypothetical protein
VIAAGRALTALGCALALMGWRWTGATAGALAWSGAVLVACLGYGAALRWGVAAWRLRRANGAIAAAAAPLPITLAAGLAMMLLLGTGLARLGGFNATAQVGQVALGLGLSLAFPPALRWPRFPLALAGVALAGFLIVCMRLFGEDRVVNDDEINHVMELARLWGTGALGPLRLQLGGQVVGEALMSLGAGADSPFLFDGVCALAMLALVASGMSRRGGFALPALAVLAPWMLLIEQPAGAMICRWPSGLLHLAMFAVLRRQLGEDADDGANDGANDGASWRGDPVLVLVLAAGLATLRYELVPVALVYAAASLLAARRADRAAGASWTPSQILRAVGIALLIGTALGWLMGGAAPPIALGKAIACLLAVPLVMGVLSLLGSYGLGSALGTALVATLIGVIAAKLALTAGGARSQATALAVLSHLPFLLVLLLEPVARPRRLFPLVAAILLAGLFTDSLFAATFRDADRTRVTNRFVELGAKAEMAHAAGLEHPIDARMRRLQLRVPAGARLGVWGKSAAQLDYRRNPISDVSWNAPRRGNRITFLGGLTPKNLGGIDYLLIESFVATRWRDDAFDLPKDKATHANPTLFVGGQLELLAEEGHEQLYRVLR